MHKFIYYLADLIVHHCVELTFLEGKLGRCLNLLMFLKWSIFSTYCEYLLHFESERKSRFISDENFLKFLTRF